MTWKPFPFRVDRRTRKVSFHGGHLGRSRTANKKFTNEKWTVEDAGPYKIKKTIEHRSFETKGESMNNKIHVKPVGTGVLDGPKNQTNFHNQSANKKGIAYRKIHRGSFVNDPYKRKHDPW